MARLFSAKPTNSEEAAQFQQYFKKHGRYTAGVETRYDPSIIIGTSKHQALAKGLKVGMRFHSAPVIRLSDGKPLELGHILKADGRWRLIVFAAVGDMGLPDGDVAKLCKFLSDSPESPIIRYTPQAADIDSVIDIRAVFQSPHEKVDLGSLPNLLLPNKGRFGLTDYEKVFCPNFRNGPDIFDHRGIDRLNGALVIVRPDQFVAKIQPTTEHEEIVRFFERFMLKA